MASQSLKKFTKLPEKVTQKFTSFIHVSLILVLYYILLNLQNKANETVLLTWKEGGNYKELKIPRNGTVKSLISLPGPGKEQSIKFRGYDESSKDPALLNGKEFLVIKPSHEKSLQNVVIERGRCILTLLFMGYFDYLF